MNIRRSIMILIVSCILCCGCSREAEETPPLLKDLTYQAGSVESDHMIYLHETSGFVPYLVLTDNYADQDLCLLLRYSLLDQSQIYNPNQRYSGYYADSAIDQYLNTSFFYTLSAYLQKSLQVTPIEITSKTSLWGGEGQTESIERRVFLLSAYEISGRSSSTQLKEGMPLAYFDSDQRRSSFSESAAVSSWWLRTPNTWYDNMVYGVNRHGVIDVGGTGRAGDSSRSGVRPAFCMSAQEEIVCLQGRWYLSEDVPVAEVDVESTP